MARRISPLLAAVPPRARPFVPGVAVVLVELSWRVGSWSAGFYPHPGGSMVLPAEGSAPWPLAALLVLLGASLLLRPSVGPALALAGAELARLVETAGPLARYAAEQVSGWSVFDPEHPIPLSPWTELGHAALHALALVLLLVGLARHRRLRALERELEAAEDAF